MTVDERLEFLLKSTESLHSSMHEMHSSLYEIRTSLEEVRTSVRDLRVTTEEQTRQFVIQAESLRQWAIVAAAHGDRISVVKRKTGTETNI